MLSLRMVVLRGRSASDIPASEHRRSMSERIVCGVTRTAATLAFGMGDRSRRRGAAQGRCDGGGERLHAYAKRRGARQVWRLMVSSLEPRNGLVEYRVTTPGPRRLRGRISS